MDENKSLTNLNDLKERFILLRAKGYSFEKLAKELGKSKQTLINWSKEFEEEIANFKSTELESLNEQFFLAKQSKIQTFGEVLCKIKTEMDTRDFSDVSTDKLMDLFLKYYSLLESERVEPRFRSSSEIEEAKRNKVILNKLLGVGVGVKEEEPGELKIV